MSSPITPAQIMDLRASMRAAIPLDTSTIGQFAHPSIIYLASDDAFGLVHGSRLKAVSADPALLAHILRCERAEPGFIDRILDPAEDCRMAALDPHAARLERQRARSEHLKSEADALAKSEALRRRNSILRPDASTLELDDLL